MNQVQVATSECAEFPTTPAQMRFWFLDQVAQKSVSSNIAVQWELRGTFKTQSLEEAFQRVVDRHEILRTSFHEVDGQAFQRVADALDFKLSVIDVRSLERADRDARIKEIAKDMATERFDLSVPGHLRAALVPFEHDRAMLLLAAHHAVFDGFSIRVLGRELGAFVEAIETGTVPDVPELDLQFGDYALWQEAMTDSGAFEAAKEYWGAALDGMPYFEIAPDRPKEAKTVRRGGRLSIKLPSSFGETLSQASKALDASPFAVGASALAATLHKFTGQSDVSFGTTCAGRGEPELDALIGVFINPVVLRYAFEPQAEMADTVRTGREIVAGALAHGDYPFDTLARDLKMDRKAARTPLISVYFGLQNVFLEEKTYGPMQIVSVPSQTPEITHDLNVLVIGRDSGWHFIIDYDADLFDEATMQAFADGLQTAFAAASANAQCKVADLAIARPALAELVSQGSAADQVPSAPSKTTAAAMNEDLAEIWSQVLNIPAAQCDDDFFVLGGHSLLSLRMLARVEKAFGVRPDIADFLALPTLRGLSDTIERLKTQTHPAAQDDWALVRLGNADAAPELIVSINQPFLYNALARKMELAANVVNLRLTGPEVITLGGAQVIDHLVSEAATQILREAQWRPVTLIGHCVDGALALKIAQQLERLGHGAQLVAMIDSWRPAPLPKRSFLRRKLIKMKTRARRWSVYLRQKLAGELSWVEFFAKNRIANRLLAVHGQAEAPTEAELREYATNVALMARMRKEDFDPYSGAVIMFSTAGQPGSARARVFDWDGWLPQDTAIYDLAGWHEDALLRDGISRISAVLTCKMQRRSAS